jgi:chromosome segregation ATPase
MARTSSVKKPLRLKDELAGLERYLENCKEQSQRSLHALRNSEPFTPHLDANETGAAAQRLQVELDALRAENEGLQAQARQLHASLEEQQADPSAGSTHALQARCARLESELAAARTATFTAGGRKGARGDHDALPSPRERSAAGTGGASSSGAAAATAGSAMSSEALRAVQQQVAQLKSDKDELEDTVVNMYEELFKDEIVSGLVGLVRRKENELVASLETSGSGNGGKKNGFAKPAPRLKAKLDDATERIEMLEKELKNRASELDAAERHHADMLKIATVESAAQAEHFKARAACAELRRILPALCSVHVCAFLAFCLLAASSTQCGTMRS